jgi:hypothetical protein
MTFPRDERKALTGKERRQRRRAADAEKATDKLALAYIVISM